MTKTELKSFRDDLLALRDRHISDVSHLTDEALRRTGGGATAAALERITHGTFGRCEECQESIPQTRLQAVPYACYCVDCAQKLEQNP